MHSPVNSPAPWNGIEPITVALERHGVGETFGLAMERGHRDLALTLLRQVGADESDAVWMIEILMPTESPKPR